MENSLGPFEPQELEQQLSRLSGQYQQAETDGRRAVSGWIRNPLVAALASGLRPQIRELVAPLARHLTDHTELCLFLARVLDFTGTYPSGDEWLNPFTYWELAASERELAPTVMTAIAATLRVLANQLNRHGVPLDPADLATQFVLGQLVLGDLDFSRPEADWLESLRFVGVGWIDRDGRSMSLSDHAGEAEAKILERIRRHIRGKAGGEYIKPPYAAGGRRRTPSKTVSRRDALRAVRLEIPSASPAAIVMTWRSSDPKTSGCLLRSTMGLSQASSPPSRKTLERDFKTLDND